MFVHVVTFPRGGQGEKVVVSGCGLCSPGVRLALWGPDQPALLLTHYILTLHGSVDDDNMVIIITSFWQ